MKSELLGMRKEAKRSLFYLARFILGYDFLIEHFHKPICDFVQDMTIHRKLVRMPRGFLKTTICSQAFPIWLTINTPNVRVLLTNMVYDNAAKNVHVIRGHWQGNKRLRELFPELIPNFRINRWSDACAEVRRPANYDVGTYESIGVGGSKIGSHYNFIIEDDLVGVKKDSLSGQEILPNVDDIQKAIGWHGLALNLLVNPKEDYIINVGTRWGQYDLIRHVIDNQPYYKRFEMDAVEMNEKGDILTDSKGNWIPTYPERFPLEVLEEIREEQGDYIFSMMYLGKPYNVEDMIFRDEWIKNFEGSLPEGKLYAGLDAAFAKERRSDFTAIPLVHISTDKEFRVHHYVRAKLNPTQIIDNIFQLKDTHKFEWIAMEKSTYEQTLKHYIDLRNRDRVKDGLLPVIVKPVKRPKGMDKAMHIRALQPLCMAEKFYIRPHMRELRNEFREFIGTDTGGHDDILDAIADIFHLVHYPQKSAPLQVRDPFSVEAVLDELLEKPYGVGRKRQLIEH